MTTTNNKVPFPRPGQLLNHRYEIVQILCSGAFGQTYIVSDRARPTSQQYVVKYYPSHRDYPNLLKTSRRIFFTEAENLKKLGIHDQIPRFIDCFEENEGFYLLQELIVGTTLSTELSLISPHRLNSLKDYERAEREIQTIFLLRDLLEVLDFIHTQGVIHGDLKPNNIIRRAKDGKLVLIDFGSAQPIRAASDEHNLFKAIPFKTTVAVSPSGYIPAEQLVGKPYPNSDLYALGIIALQMLTGLDPGKLQINLETHEIQWIALAENAKFAPKLVAIIEKMSRYNHEFRYQSAREVLADLDTLLPQAHHTLADLANVYLAENNHEREAELEVSSEGTFSLFPLFPDSSEGNLIDFDDHWLDDVQYLSGDELEQISETEPLSNQTSKGAKPDPNRDKWLAGASIGLVGVSSLAVALGSYYLLNPDTVESGATRLAKARQAYNAGKIERAIALARSIPTDSPVYTQSQTVIQQWQTDWSKAALYFKSVQQAYQQQQWQEVIDRAALVPPINYWQNQLKPMVQQAKKQAEIQAQTLMTAAFKEAEAKNFTIALSYLQQISPHTTIGTKIKPKIQEYQEKQQMRGMFFLQQAYNRAQQGDFAGAINFLKRVPPQTPAGAIAKIKAQEYTQKQQLRRQELTIASSPSPEPFSKLEPFTRPHQDHQTNSNLEPGNHLLEIIPFASIWKH